MSKRVLEIAEAKRPLPTLAQWLDQQTGGERAEHYDAMAGLMDLAERTIKQDPSFLAPNEACFLRLWQGMCVATVELCNIEVERKDTPVHVLVAMLPRALAAASIYAFASVAKDDAPLRDIAKLLTEEFRYAAKAAADDLMANG